MAVTVHHGSGWPWKITPTAMNMYIPRMGFGPTRIDLDLLARTYSSASGRVSVDHAKNALKAVFHLLKDRDLYTFIYRLEGYLHDILQKQRSNSPARLRRHFITIAYLAYEGESYLVAECLLRFFLQNRQIIAEDDRRNLDDWDHAIRRLANVYPCRDVNIALAYIRRKLKEAAYHHPPRYDPYNSENDLDPRGRQPDRFDPWRRSRTMPPIIRTPSLRLPAPRVLPLPVPAPTGMLTSFPSPALYAASDPMMGAEVNDMKVHQQYLEDRLNVLEYNQQALEQEVVQDSFNPLQLTFG